MQFNTPTQPPVVLGYQAPVDRRQPKASRCARAFAGVLALAALGLGYGVVAQGWTQNPVLASSAALLFAVAAALALRTANLCRRTRRIGWVAAVAAFGFWTVMVLSNQFHGRPPPSDLFFLAGFAAAFVLSAIALAIDPSPRRAA